MPIPKAASYISSPLQPHRLYNVYNESLLEPNFAFTKANVSLLNRPSFIYDTTAVRFNCGVNETSSGFVLELLTPPELRFQNAGPSPSPSVAGSWRP